MVSRNNYYKQLRENFSVLSDLAFWHLHVASLDVYIWACESDTISCIIIISTICESKFCQ